MRRLCGTILAIFALCTMLCIPTSAKQATYTDTQVKAVGFQAPNALFDQKRTTYATAKNGEITLTRQDGIAHLYIEFDRVPTTWTLTDTATGKSVTCGTNGFLHEYVDVSSLLGGAPKALTLRFADGTVIADVYAFSGGELPDFVQKWEPPHDKADILLLSSHSDDEQLFFAGVLPYYAVERDLQVQVAYLVQHFEANGVKEHRRPHEQLDGLWTVGVRHYPVMSDFPDVYAESKDRETAFKQAEKVFAAAGVTYDDFKEYITTCLRRFKPLVVVSHDLDGEYGHGTHVFGAAALTEALKAAPDKTVYPESAENYGAWQVEKTYLHLYDKNPIVMDWDTPLESLGGKTAFQVTQDGFACHKSQHWTWFYGWIYGKSTPITKASQIRSYSPCKYGLYDTQVGVDVVGGDFMENVQSYAERKAAALEQLQSANTTAPTTAPTTATTAPQERDDPADTAWLPMLLLVLLVVFIVLLILFIFKRRHARCKH